MKMKEIKVNKVCSFYVNEWHLTTMMLPYMNRRLEENTKVMTILENGIQDKVEELISKMNLSKESTNKVLNISWTSNKMFKYGEIKKWIEEQLEEDKDIDILVDGTTDYIDIVNRNIEKVINENKKKVKNKRITVINCYEVTQFNNINDVLEKHNSILNTSGIKQIEEVFEGYEKAGTVNVAN